MQRRTTTEVSVGALGIGSMHPVRIQSMTTTLTMDTEATIAQSIRMIEAGCEIVRITAPSLREAKNLGLIREGLKARGYDVPICADIHFTPNAAEVAARLVEKVRINPGNYVDKKNFSVYEYDDAAYAAEIDRIRDRFVPLISICKEHGTAMRIGTNHGSLSDRIMSRYGDNPQGMVESALEFLRIAESENYYNIVLSMKSSNPLVMVEAYRLLVERLEEEGLRPYPLHLGVTEAGEGEDGRVKSAVGIGTLLQEGLGDTIRVSLTEEPEAELPVARRLAERPLNAEATDIFGLTNDAAPPAAGGSPHRVANIGGTSVPRVIADCSSSAISRMQDLEPLGHVYDAATDKWTMTEQGCDYIYSGSSPIPFMLPNGVREILDAPVWMRGDDKLYKVPLFASPDAYAQSAERHKVMNLVVVELLKGGTGTCAAIGEHVLAAIRSDATVVLIVRSDEASPLIPMRNFFFDMNAHGLSAPVIIYRASHDHDLELHQLSASTDIGGLFVDGFGDGIMMHATDRTLAFNILQATRKRITKTEYISCPSCGRTLFDLQETTAAIREQTDHLKGLKIGVMGCIVNGPGEMADADYGYVGSGPERITLYRGKEIVRRNIPTADALQELVAIIKEDDRWVERS